MRPRLDRPIKATLSVTNACPLDCAHCYSFCTREPGPDELSTAEWLAVLRDLHDSGAIGLLVEGGEPLLRPDLPELLAYCRGRFLTWLRTHALGITPALAAELRALRLGAVCVDLFGASAAVHDQGSGVPGSFEETVQGIRTLRAAGLPVIPLMILTRRTVGELQGFLELARALGCERASVLRLYPIGRARERWEELACSLGEMTAALGGLRVPAGLQLMQSWHPRNPNCCWESAAVTAQGRSVGCPYLREYVDHGDVRAAGGFMATWDQPLYRRLRQGLDGAGHQHDGDARGTCAACRGSEGTAGGCRSTAYAFRGDWDAPDPFCIEQNHGTDLRLLPGRPQPAAAPGAGMG